MIVFLIMKFELSPEQKDKLTEHDIELVSTDCITNAKAQESYIMVKIKFSTSYVWEGHIPHIDRRLGINIVDSEHLIKYLIEIKEYFSKENINKFKEDYSKYWEKNHPKGKVTFSIFNDLIKMESIETIKYKTQNPARRIQAIKDKGFTVVSFLDGGKYKRRMLPIFRKNGIEHQSFSKKFKDKIIKTLENKHALYPEKKYHEDFFVIDHKFPNIRWDEHTIDYYSDSMTDDEMIESYQLLDNHSNMLKREVCKKCFNENKRGKILGIDFYYQGDEEWSHDEVTGIRAKDGCVGCGWYDIKEWREKLQNKLQC